MVKVDRRVLLASGAAMAALPVRAATPPKAPIYIADMHYHLFFGVGRRPVEAQPLGPNMAKGQATLVSWSLVGDMPWLTPAGGTFKQKGKPAKGEAPAWLTEEAARVKAHAASQNVALVRTPDDVVAAASGKPHIVLSVEGATFVDDGLKHLEAAYALGVRHLQLVHFIENPLGDMQTERATRGGLTSYGREVVAECNRLGILIDLAHCTEQSVEQVLAATKAPVVWSHSSVRGRWQIYPTLSPWGRRQLSFGAAKAIASANGVIGLWALGDDVGTTAESYGARMLELADLLGDDAVAFGTDMNALGKPAVSSFSELRKAVVHMAARAPDARVRKAAFENYARVLTAAMRARTA